MESFFDHNRQVRSFIGKAHDRFIQVARVQTCWPSDPQCRFVMKTHSPGGFAIRVSEYIEMSMPHRGFELTCLALHTIDG